MYGTQVNSTKQSTPTVGLPKSSSARDSKKIVAYNSSKRCSQKFLLVTKLAQSYWKKKETNCCSFPYLIWCKNIQIAQQKYSSEFYEAINSNCRAFQKFNWLRFQKTLPAILLKVVQKKCSKVAPKKEKKGYYLFYLVWLKKCTNCMTKVRFRNIFFPSSRRKQRY